jgi:hypothetical protein
MSRQDANLAKTGRGANLSSGSLWHIQSYVKVIYIENKVRFMNERHLNTFLESKHVDSCWYLCTQMTASTMPDLSISIAIVVTMPVHWAPMNTMKILQVKHLFIYHNKMLVSTLKLKHNKYTVLKDT